MKDRGIERTDDELTAIENYAEIQFQGFAQNVFPRGYSGHSRKGGIEPSRFHHVLVGEVLRLVMPLHHRAALHEHCRNYWSGGILRWDDFSRWPDGIPGRAVWMSFKLTVREKLRSTNMRGWED